MASSSGNSPVSSFDQIVRPSTLTSNAPPPAGSSVSVETFCLSSVSRWAARLTAFGS